MKTMKLGFVFVLFVAAASVLALKDDKKTFQAIYKKMDAAAKKSDINGYMKMTTSDYTMTGQDGKSMSRDEVIAMIKMYVKATKKMEKFQTTVTKVEVDGDSATVWTKSLVVMKGTDPMNPKDKKVHNVKDESTSKDSWTKMKGKWMLKASEMLSDKMTVDGKPYTPPAGGGG